MERHQKVFERFSQMKSRRAPWESLWRELADYYMPRKDSWNGEKNGQQNDELIFDSTPTHALELQAAALHGRLTNPAGKWFALRVREQELRDDQEVKEFLSSCEERMLAKFGSESTGFQEHLHEMYLDILLFGVAAMLAEEDDDNVVRFNALPVSDIYIDEDDKGRVNAVFITVKMSLRAAKGRREWDGRLSKTLDDAFEEQPDKRVEFLHCIYPRANRNPGEPGVSNFPFASEWWEVETKHLVAESGYHEMPVMVPRWSKASGEHYGRSPAMSALADVRVLNRMALTAMVSAEKLADPPLLVPDDGVLGVTRTGPGDVITYRAGMGMGDGIRNLPITPDLRSTDAMMQQKRESVRIMHLNDQMQLTGGAQMTATEVMQRQEEKMLLLAPVLGRLQAEFLSPLIERVFGIMLRAGEFGPLPAVLEGQNWGVEYVSPVARAQRAGEVQSVLRLFEFAAPFIAGGDAMGLLDNVDMDKAFRFVGEAVGAPAQIFRSPEDVEQLRQMRQQQQAQAQQMAMIDQGARTAKVLSETSLGDDKNALQALTGG